jgi:endonuclease/exonuclease/phosphatase family metal-dependent hydrolase
VRSKQGGADFHLTVVHLDSGTKQRDFDHRVAAIQRIDDLFQTLQATQSDADLIVLGDFNTMGASGVASPEAEIESFLQEVTGLTPPMTALIPSLACTECFGGSCGVLDHVVVAKDMAEAANATAIVSGYCAAAGGAEFQPGIMPLACENLSDHCPVVIQIEDADRD